MNQKSCKRRKKAGKNKTVDKVRQKRIHSAMTLLEGREMVLTAFDSGMILISKNDSKQQSNNYTSSESDIILNVSSDA